jgi:pseudouridine kinase
MKILVIGGANIDITGVAAAPLRQGDSNPARVRLSGGGVGRNIACNLARLGAAVTFAGAVGNDAFGRLLRESLAEAGLDDSALIVRQGLPTGLYLALMEPDGGLFAAVNDMEAALAVAPADVEALRGAIRAARLLVVDANLRPDTLEAAARLATAYNVPLMADAVSVSKAARLSAILPHLALLKANRAEAETLAGFPLETEGTLREGCRALLDAGPHRVYLTRGEQGSCAADKDAFCMQPALPAVAMNVNGAGDAFAAGAAFSFCLGGTLAENARFGAACAAITVESADAVSKNLSHESVQNQLAGLRMDQER